ncbi:MAG: TolC family outer membrane protein [Novosphingobium sp.]
MCLALISSAQATTMQEALEAAYQNNPKLTAQRANVRVADENVPIARAASMPVIDGTVSYQENILKGDNPPGGFVSDPDRQLVGQINATLPLITFGVNKWGVAAADERVKASRYGLRGGEADLFTAVVGAYMDVIRDEAVVRLNQRNTQVIGFNLQETTDRYKAGNRGPADVAQSEARLSLAQAQSETAQSKLITSRESFIQLVGSEPGVLAPPPPLPELPTDPNVAVEYALQNNPNILAAMSQRIALSDDVRVADGERKPRLEARASLNHYDYLNSLAPGTGPRNGDRGTTANVGVALRVPLFSGGRLSALYRQAVEKEGVGVEQVVEAQRTVVAQTRSAFATWVAAQRVIAAAERGAAANQRALQALGAQVDAGVRPLLDKLNAEQELLNSQVTLVTARRDAYVAGFALLAAMGRAEAKDLNFESSRLYDPTVHYDKVRNQIFQLSDQPVPAAKAQGTSGTRPQDAQVTPADGGVSDPALSIRSDASPAAAPGGQIAVSKP